MSMSEALERAKTLLKEEGRTLVIVDGSEVYTSSERGVKPLLSLYEQGKIFSCAVAADKVVGKGAAVFYSLLGVKEVYATIMSRPAEEYLKKRGVFVAFGEKVEMIKNRAGDGFCPIESAVLNTEDEQEALFYIRQALKRLSSSGK